MPLDKFFLAFYLSLILFSCGEQKTAHSERIARNTPLQAQSDPIRSKPTPSHAPKDTCRCPQSTYKRKLYEHRVYLKRTSNWQDTLKRWSQDSLRLKVRSIRLSGFDTIPKEISVFRNVEDVLVDHNGAEGLDMFHKLKSVSFFEVKTLTINPKHQWLKRIEYFEAVKSYTFGFTSFALMPNLRVLSWGGGVKPFPTDIEVLTCLEELQIGFLHLVDGSGQTANTGKIDLSEMDLSKLHCLKLFDLYSYSYKNIFGIPRGIDTTRTFKLDVRHQQLTGEEKEKIRSFNKRRMRSKE